MLFRTLTLYESIDVYAELAYSARSRSHRFWPTPPGFPHPVRPRSTEDARLDRMLKLRCTCGETYHSDETYIGSSILCRRCDNLIPIRHLASLLDGKSFPQNPGPSSFGPKIGGIRSRKLMSPIFAAVLVVVVATLVVLKASAPKQSSETSGQSSTTSEHVSTENQSTTPAERTPTKSTDRPPGADHDNRENPSSAPRRIEPLKEPSTIASRIDPTDLMDRDGPQAKRIRPMPPSEMEPNNPRSLALGATPFGPGIASGHSTLLVKNGTDTDAMVRVIELGLTAQMVRNFYIPAGRNFTSESVPPGNYVLRVALGKDWNDSQRHFNYRQSFKETQPFEISETTNVEQTAGGLVTHTRFDEMSITLHKVANGNFQSHPISEEQFWR